MSSSAKSSAFEMDPHERVKQLANFDSTQLVDPRVPLHRYFRSGNEMLRMAIMYNKEGQIENAFILMSKYITLFVEQVPKHPDYKSYNKDEKAKTKEKLMVVFPEAEKLKVELEKKYRLEHEKYVESKKKADFVNETADLLERKKNIRGDSSFDSFDSQSLGSVSLSSNKTSLSPSSATNIKVGSQCFESSDDELIHSRCSSTITTDSIIYPDVNTSRSPSGLSNRSVPLIDRSTKPRSLLSPGPETVYQHGLRLVVIPDNLIEMFLQHVKNDYLRDIETCGILTGKLVKNQLIVTNLVIPHQTGSVDSCSADDEREIFAYQEKHNLLTIGWIHTHPTQTAFLSSVDLHTHCAYQLAMPEAVAVVCSTKFNENKIFTLTDFGLDYITGCRQPGFHVHDTQRELYIDSPHVKIENSSLVVADMRDGPLSIGYDDSPFAF